MFKTAVYVADIIPVRTYARRLGSVEIASVHEGDSTTLQAGLLTSESTSFASFPPNKGRVLRQWIVSKLSSVTAAGP